MRHVIGRPSPAMLVALLALFVALGGSGYAAVTKVLFAKQAANADKVDGVSASTKPRPRHLVPLDSHGKFPSSVGLTGRRGPQGLAGPEGAQGPQGPQGAQGDRGNPGAPGTALAYSLIAWGDPDEGPPPKWHAKDAFSKRIDNTVNLGDDGHPKAGVFCFHRLSFTVANAVATPGPFGPSGPFLVQVDVPRPQDGTEPPHSVDPSCPADTGAAVYVTNASGTLEDPPDTSDSIFVAFN